MTIHEINKAAKAAGLTYGQYVNQKEAPVMPKPKEATAQEPDNAETRICLECGKEFLVDLSDGRKKKQKYCSKLCNTAAVNARAKKRKAAAQDVALIQAENRALRTELMMNKPSQPDQTAKADAGKARLTLVPTRIIWDIAAVRQYGVEIKYPETGMDGWRDIGSDRIKDAAMRHFLRYLSDPTGKDEESGLPHLWHCATNIAFLLELEDNHG